MQITYFRVVWIAIFSIILTAGVVGQGISTGTIIGIVHDGQGALVQHANVTAVQIGTNVTTSAETNLAGEFQVRNLTVGLYQITIKADGFSSVTVRRIVVNAGVPTDIGVIALSVSGSKSEILITESSPLLQTDPVQISSTFETAAVQNLPFGNGIDSLAFLVPGVASTGDANFSNANGAGFSTNGQRGRDNNFQIDGQSNNDIGVGGPVLFFGNQDAIQEVQILTNYSAEYGHTTGAIVNYITKQGNNVFHGSAFEIYNGNWADSMANQDKSMLFGFCPSGVAAGTATAEAPVIPGVSNGCTTPVVPRYVDNRFGGSIGGPILKDKLWFFGSANLERQTGGNATATSGNLVLPDPTGLAELEAAFPGNPAVGALAAIGPSNVSIGNLRYGTTEIIDVGPPGGPTVPVEFATFTRTIPVTFNDNEVEGRLDWRLSSQDRIFGRYIYQSLLATNQPFDGGPAAAAGDFDNIPGTNQELGIDYTHIFSTSFLNQIRYNYLNEDSAFNPAGFTTCRSGSIAGCPTNIAFFDTSNTFDTLGVGPGFPQERKVLIHQLQDNASWLHSRHSFKFGVEFNHQSNPNFYLPFVDGYEAFIGTAANTIPPIPAYSSFDYYLANSGYVSLGLGNPAYTFHENQLAFYFQDNWRLRDNLTLSLGLRWELYGQPINSLHNETVARESNPSTALWSTTDTSGAVSPLSARTVGSQPINYKDFAPIIGFSYAPKLGWLGKHTTVIRGGFRLSYDPEFYNLFSNIATASPAISLVQFAPCTSCVTASGTGAAVAAANTFPTTDVGLASQAILAHNLRNPYTEQWSLGIQHEFGPKIVSEVRYLGSHSLKQFQFFNANPALGPLVAAFPNLIPSGYAPCTDPTQAGFAGGLEYANCKQTQVSGVGNSAFSEFEGLEARLDTREWHGATIGISYTYSHTIDNTSEISSTNAGGNTVSFAQNPFNIGAAERGNSGIDFPNVVSVYMLYAPPFFENQNTLTGKLLGGWQIAPLYRYTSGQPYTAVQNHASGSFCDPNDLFGGVDACRPIIANTHAPINTVGYCTNFAAPDCGISVIDPTTGLPTIPTTMSAVHWIQNDNTAAEYFGNPFAGAGRNIYRGQAINAISLTVLKDVKFKERYSLQLRATAYNLLNHQFRGVPDPNVSDATGIASDVPGSFGNNYYKQSGSGQPNSIFNGIDRRRIEIGLKILF